MRSSAGQPSRVELRRVNDEARAAREKKDYPAFLSASRRLVELAPRSTRALENLAGAEALSGDADEAFALLERLARMGVYVDVSSNDDLASLRDAGERFRAMRERMESVNQPLVRAQELALLPERDLLTEGVAFDPNTGDVFVSSVHRRKIVRITKGGKPGDFVSEGSDGLLSAVGMAVDADRRSLFVASVGSAFTRGIPEDRKETSEVLEYGIDDRRLRRRIAPPAGPPGTGVSDLALGPDGVVYAADPRTGGVYAADRRADRFRVLVPAGSGIGSAQGMTVTPDGASLFVSDYTSGIWRVDPSNGSARLLDAPLDAALTGIDGLVSYRGSLVGIRNGFRPHAILRLRLSADLGRIEEATVLERADPRWDEPTLGVVADGTLIYVARSQYRRFSDEGAPAVELSEPLLLRLALDWQ